MKKRLCIRMLSVFLALAAVFPVTLTGCGKKGGDSGDEDVIPDDPSKYYLSLEEKEPVVEVALDFGSRDFILSNPSAMGSPAISESMIYENDSASYYWNCTSSLRFVSPAESDWSEYDHIEVAIYSGKKTMGTVQVRFINPKRDGSTAEPYFRYPITVDWTGWKVFVMDMQSLGGNYSPSWHDISAFSFDMAGWDLDPRTGNELYIGTFRLISTEYEVVCPEGVSVTDDAIYDKVKNQWREFSLGSPNGYKNPPKEITDKITSVSQKCKSSWDRFKSTYKKGTRDSAFGITIVQGKAGDESKINTIYAHILNMVKGYGTVGSDYYHDAKLLKDIKSALDYAYEFYYGPNVWEKGKYGNWWYWDIGIPLTLTEIIIDLEHDLEYDDLVKYLSPFDYLDYYPSMTACNKVWISICVFASAFIQKDAERILISKAIMNDVFDYVSSGDGFYEDGSFVQHTAFPYTGGYGLSMLNTMTELLLIMRGSRFDFIEENVSNQYRWVFENYQPVIYGANFMASMRGREVYRNTSEASALGTAVTSLIKMTTYAPADIKPKLEALIRYYMKSANNNYATSVPLMLTEYAIALDKNDSVGVRTGYELVKVFGNMDRIVQHGEKYGVCIAPNSSRIFKYEAINNENMTGWYQSEGMIFIYTDGYDYNYDFYGYVDPYKMPGTTVSTMKRTEENITSFYGSSPFVGGVEAGKYGLAVFSLGYPATKYVTPDIKANKSYFLFDNEIVCVGSGIREPSGNEVLTIVENRNIRNGDKFIVDGSEITPKTATTTVGCNYMYFGNMGGYVFPGGAEVNYAKSDKVKTSFLEIWISHGKRPTSGKYSYIYLPEATAAETETYNNAPDVEILEVSDGIHVVREKKLGLTGYAFYTKGTSNGVTVSEACCVMVGNSGGTLTVNVSDPTHLLEKFTVTIDAPGVASVVSADEGVTAKVENGKLILTVTPVECVGETYTVTAK